MDDKTPSFDLTDIKTTIFKQEQSQSCCCCWPSWCCRKRQVTYRIPALLYISENKTYLAFAEKRKTPSDTDADKLVMRRGLWEDDKNNIKWDSTHQLLSSACLPNHRSMNPCPVYERESKTIFLFFICVPYGVSEASQIEAKKNQARLCYITSQDNGNIWSDITELKDVISEHEKNWATFAVGPGHGIQMKDGRLIIPGYVYYFVQPNAPKSHAVTFCSDDKGHTWHVGKHMEGESNECQMAEITDDSYNSLLYCNARSRSGYRVEALSTSKGEAFEKPFTVQKLKETDKGCQGSVLYIPSPPLLLYSHPTTEHKRKNLGIYVNKSPSDPSQWTYNGTINNGPSGYSDLAECENREYIACLMECGQKREIEEIAFKFFKINNAVESP
ncbi:sialidase-3 isoform X3 [Carassius gibelio]|uniref:sialidase-3 isoform X3 n=1 Tax=Carassius gibelio TaxID=101364 RepID=UPI0022774CBD|nr:sialidase-3 isoform X3 [Carassius gibelio]XP_052392821.1 sialidase-3 isoform X3 [Carassius gibelio]XP_052392822.1 sialidase-3 isoform X3 [Carassius gibelio]XP_052392823.1 sialidase-3 isoform X3 [Carassius gibelio]XP_052392824.1 sialidase-3 isoform X3 [Carassius gibelio]